MNEIKRNAERLYVQLATGIALLGRTSPKNRIQGILTWKRAWELAYLLSAYLLYLAKNADATNVLGEKFKSIDLGKSQVLVGLIERCLGADGTLGYALASLDLAIELEGRADGLSELFAGIDDGTFLTRTVPEPSKISLFDLFRQTSAGKSPESPKARAIEVNRQYREGVVGVGPELVEPRLTAREVASFTLLGKGNDPQDVRKLLAGPAQAPPTSEERERAISYLKSLGKADDEINQLLKGPA